MVIHIYCKLEGMRGPHSKHRLAIQLSKTELHRSNRDFQIRTLATAGVTKTTELVQVGAPYLPLALLAVKRAFYRKLRRPSDRRSRLSTPGSSSRQASLGGFRGPVLLRAGQLLSPLRVPRQESGPVTRSVILRGARYVAPPRKAVKKYLDFAALPPCSPSRRGAPCSRAQNLCQVGVAARHAPMAATPRRHCAAALSASRSGLPASLARAARTISSRQLCAASRSPFTSTYW